VTTADIDDLYAQLLRGDGRDGRTLNAGTVHRVHVVLPGAGPGRPPSLATTALESETALRSPIQR
jgi:hypothetical protein